jgi:hypothetical protein
VGGELYLNISLNYRMKSRVLATTPEKSGRNTLGGRKRIDNGGLPWGKAVSSLPWRAAYYPDSLSPADYAQKKRSYPEKSPETPKTIY